MDEPELRLFFRVQRYLLWGFFVTLVVAMLAAGIVCGQYDDGCTEHEVDPVRGTTVTDCR